MVDPPATTAAPMPGVPPTLTPHDSTWWWSTNATMTPPPGAAASTPFCPDPLWDKDLTWNTDNPEFTACFQGTVLVYTPALLLLVFGPLEVYLARASRDRGIPWSLLGLLKVILNLALIVGSGLDLAYAIWKRKECTYIFFFQSC